MYAKRMKIFIVRVPSEWFIINNNLTNYSMCLFLTKNSNKHIVLDFHNETKQNLYTLHVLKIFLGHSNTSFQ